MQRIILWISILMCVYATGNEVIIQFDITHNIKPPLNLPNYTVAISNGVISKEIKSGDRIPKGSYQVTISQPGYETKIVQKQYIEGESFKITQQLIAKKRRISRSLLTHSACGSHDILRITDLKTQKIVDFDHLFVPGGKVYFLLEFKKYDSLKIEDTIRVGEGPHYFCVPETSVKTLRTPQLWVAKKNTKLSYLELVIKKKHKILDGITYHYDFSVDGKPLAKNKLKVEYGIGRFFYMLWLDQEAKLLRISSGYLYIEKDIKDIQSHFSVQFLDRISVEKLVDHLKKVGVDKGTDFAKIMWRILEEERKYKRLQKCSPEDLNKLFTYLDDLKIQEAKYLKKEVMEIVQFPTKK